MATLELAESHNLLQYAVKAARSPMAENKKYEVVAAFVLDGTLSAKGFRSKSEVVPYFEKINLTLSEYVTIDRKSEHVIWMT